MLITEPALLQYLGDAFWPFMRLTGVFLTAPLLGNAILPVPFRVLLAALLAACLASWGGPWPPFPAAPGAVLFSGLVELAFGALMGLIGQIVVAAIASAGELASFALGISFATANGLTTNAAAPVLYDILQWAGLLVYLGLGGPFLVLEAVNRSFHTLPAGVPDAANLRDLVDYGGAAIRVCRPPRPSRARRELRDECRHRARQHPRPPAQHLLDPAFPCFSSAASGSSPPRSSSSSRSRSISCNRASPSWQA